MVIIFETADFLSCGSDPEEQILEFDKWEFYSNGQRGKDYRNSERLCDNLGGEYSVSYHPFLKRDDLVYSGMGISEKILMRTSKKPEGPWSDEIEVYSSPEAGWSRNYISYAGRSHIELSGSKDLLIIVPSTNQIDFLINALTSPNQIRALF